MRRGFWVLACIAGMSWTPGILAADRWTQYTNTEAITAMAEDGRHIWLGTPGGLIRIHKTAPETTLFTVANSELTDVSVKTLASNGSGRVAVVSQNGGLTIFDGATSIRLSGHESLREQTPFDVAWGAGGALWVFAADQHTRLPSLFRWHKNAWSRFYLEGGDPFCCSNRFQEMTYSVYLPYSLQRPWLQSDSKGRIWAMVLKKTKPMLYRVDSLGDIDTVPVPHHLNPMQVVVSDTGIAIWLGGMHLARPSATGWDTTRLPERGFGYTAGSKTHPRNLFARDADGSELWALENNVVYRLGRQGWDSLTQRDLRATNAPLVLSSSSASPDARVYLAAAGRVGTVKGSAWNFTDVSKRAFRASAALSIAPQGVEGLGMVLGVTSGVDLFDPTKSAFKPVELPAEWGNQSVTSTVSDRKGRVWMTGYSDSGIWIWDGQSRRVTPEGWSGFPTSSVGITAFMAEDSSGTLWFADQSRLLASPRGSEDVTTWKSHPLPEPWNEGGRIGAIAAHPDGSVWMTVNSNNEPQVGIASFHPTSGWRVFDSLPVASFYAAGLRDIHCDRAGHVWVRYQTTLLRWNGKEWQVSNPVSPGSTEPQKVAAMTVDGAGNVWLATANPQAALYHWSDTWGWNLEVDNIFSTTSIQNMAFDGKGQLWMTTYPASVLVYNAAGTVSTWKPWQRALKPRISPWIRNFDLNGRTLSK